MTSTAEDIKGVDTGDIFSVSLIFREDAFDPVSRVRRGRFYEKNPSQPVGWHVYPHPALTGEEQTANRLGVLLKDLATFHACAMSQKHFAKTEHQPLVVLGNAQRFTVWVLVSSEMSLTGEEIVSLRSRATFGALPELLWDKVPQPGRASIKNTLNILSEDIYRAGPESVIDRARDVASAILSAYVVDRSLAAATKDLGKLVDVLGKLPRDDRPNICKNGGDIIAILHPRAKPSEQALRPLRPIREQDAELAVQLVGTMLCDLGWAQWR
ncbi:MAG: hypothetical protein ACYCXT_01040 [Acidiferrobacteraceae bacterium]